MKEVWLVEHTNFKYKNNHLKYYKIFSMPGEEISRD